MILHSEIKNNNTTYLKGDTFIVSYSEKFNDIKSINSISFDFSPLDNNNAFHNIYIRYSYDGIQFSAWEAIKTNLIQNPDITNIFNRICSKPNFNIEFKIVRGGEVSSINTLNSINIDYILNPKGIEEHNNSPFCCLDCATTRCVVDNATNGISLQCDKELFRPYDVIAPATQMYNQLNNVVSEMFGHCVRYFKTTALQHSADQVLKEYSIFDTTDVKDIKIIVPDNEIPDNAINFVPFDMDFGDGFEVHIVREHFQRAFGLNTRPEQKDYLYFPLLDRVYEISSAYLTKQTFMATPSYYKVMLMKWQDRENVMKSNPEIAEYIDNLTDNFDEILEPGVQEDIKRVTKPLQHKTISVGGYDHIRSEIHDNMKIESAEINNYFTVVAKYFYNMVNIPYGELAVKYKLGVCRYANQSTAFTAWFKTTKTSFSNKTPNTSDILLSGYYDNKGYQIELLYKDVNGSVVTDGFRVKINSQIKEFKSGFPALDKDKWYAFVINQSNDFSQVSLNIWEMKYNKQNPSVNKTTDLRLIYSAVDLITAEDVIVDTTFELLSGTYAITNVNIFGYVLEEEKQPLVLNQYIVKDSELSLLADRSIPPLNIPRYNTR